MFWPPQDTTGWELAPGPDACCCGTPACRSGWEWLPVAASPTAEPDEPTPNSLAGRTQAEREAKAAG
jgi:hypothetical protein